MAGNLTGLVHGNIAEVSTAIANGDLSRKITVEACAAESSKMKETLNTMVDQLNRFASEVTRVARESARKASLAARPTFPALREPGRI